MTKAAGAPILIDDFQDDIDDLDDRISAFETGNPRCRVSKSGAQTIPDITGTALTWDVESWDVGPCHSGSSSQLVAPQDGIYEGLLYVVWENNTVGYRKIIVRANGSTDIGGLKDEAEGSEATVQTTGWEVFLSEGDYVEGLAYFDASGSPDELDVIGAYMTMRYLGTTT